MNSTAKRELSRINQGNPMSYSTEPTLDADRYLTELHRVQVLRDAEQDVSAADPAVNGMKCLRQFQITPWVCARLICGVAKLISKSGWSHTQEAVYVIQSLDDLSDYLKEAA